MRSGRRRRPLWPGESAPTGDAKNSSCIHVNACGALAASPTHIDLLHQDEAGAIERATFLARHASTPLTCTDSYALHIDVTHAISV